MDLRVTIFRTTVFGFVVLVEIAVPVNWDAHF